MDTLIMMKSPHHFPEQINVAKHADVGFSYQGNVALSRFDRVLELLDSKEQPSAQSTITINCELYRSAERIIRFTAHIEALLNLCCVTCSASLAHTVNEKLSFAIIEESEQIGLLAESEDYVMLDEQMLVHGVSEYELNVLAMIEDELLLSIPMQPKHVDCQIAQRYAAQTTTPQQKHNPFDVLTQLKVKTQ